MNPGVITAVGGGVMCEMLGAFHGAVADAQKSAFHASRDLASLRRATRRAETLL